MKKITSFIIIVCAVLLANAHVDKVDTLQYSGPFAINIVIVGDGYTISELDLYDEDAQRVCDGVFSETPFKEYKSFFNVFSIQVASKESGIKCCKKHDHCTECEDPDNYFGSSIVEGTLVNINTNLVNSTVNKHIHNYDNIIVIVNSDYDFGTAFGGTCISVNPRHSSYEAEYYVVLHELGHSLGGLGDEYNSGSKEYHERQIKRGYPNIDITANPKKNKWRLWFGIKGIGANEHIPERSYIPHPDCRMKKCSSEFCAVCTEQLIIKFYSFINLKKTSYFSYCATPNKNEILVEDSEVIWFYALTPKPNTLFVQWFLDNELIAMGTDRVLLSAEKFQGRKTLKVSVIDTTSMIISEELRKKTFFELKWNIHFKYDPIETKPTETNPPPIEIKFSDEAALENDELLIIYTNYDTILNQRVYFGFDKSYLPYEELEKLLNSIQTADSLYKLSGTTQPLKAIISGFADTIGSIKYNETLSLQRASYVLMSMSKYFSFHMYNIELSGNGELDMYPELWQNRFVEIILYHETNTPHQKEEIQIVHPQIMSEIENTGANMIETSDFTNK